VKIFKFGGASIATPELVENLKNIVQSKNEKELIVVISAKGKTTNALEKIVDAHMAGLKEVAQKLFLELKEDHLAYAHILLNSDSHEVFNQLNSFFTEIEWALAEEAGRSYNYYYDQIVCIGELLSTSIISAYLNSQNIENEWVDSRDLVRTNDVYRDAKVDWDTSEKLILDKLSPILALNKIVIAQGFIGATDENNSVTLGREGSDFSASIYASILDAESVTIWKDVPALLNADPKQFEETVEIPEISYREVIELAFYGAQVIHPKTIKPLQNKQIPLLVKSFLSPESAGTVIKQLDDFVNYPPLMVWKKDQVLIELSTLDFSFINEDNLALIYSIFHKHRVKMNITQNAAIGFSTCVDDRSEKNLNLIQDLSSLFKVKHNEEVELLCIRHYKEDLGKPFTEGRDILLSQRSRHTIKYILQ